MHHILLIEDEDSLRSTLADLLTMEGFVVATAATGEQGLRSVEERPPDLILCDIVMPGLDGYGVLRKLQLDERTATIPFIFLTANASSVQVRDGMELGADDYLCKPVAMTELLSAIRTRLWKRDQQHEHFEHEVAAARQDVVRKLPHELLTPITGLLSASQLLETADDNLSLSAIHELGRVTRVSARRLHRMVRRFFLYAELQAASQRMEAQARLRGTTSIPATAWVSALAEHLARQYSRAADLSLHLQEVALVMDASHFAELVAQLVDNAFKFSPSGSVVQVHLSRLPSGICLLTVRDLGRGMTPEHVHKMGAFRQFDQDLWAQPGTGLGLALVQQIATLYGGDLVLESEPGNGTQATVRLPNAQPGVAPASELTDEVQRKVAQLLGSQ